MPMIRVRSRTNSFTSRSQMAYVTHNPCMDHRLPRQSFPICRIRSISFPSSSRMARPVRLEEHVVKARLLDLQRPHAPGEVGRQPRHELRPMFHLKVQFAVHLLHFHVILCGDVLLEVRVAGDDDLVAADEPFEDGRRVEGLDFAVVDDGDAIAVLGLFHVVGGHENGDADLVAQPADVAPHGVARLRVEAGRRFVEEQDGRVMQQAAGDLQPSLHAAGEGATSDLRRSVSPTMPSTCSVRSRRTAVGTL